MRAILLRTRMVLTVFLVMVPLLAGADTLTREQMEHFLRTAKIVDAKLIGKGVTRPWRLTLTDGTLTHDAAFQSVNRQRSGPTYVEGRPVESQFIDAWRYNLAAYRLAHLLGIGHMVPVTVERRWQGKDGALTWWADVLMDAEQLNKSGTKAPDPEAFGRENHRMRVFAALVDDTDRNQGNILITSDWGIAMIDFTRAFRRAPTPPALPSLLRCDRVLLSGMRELTKEGVEKAVGRYLNVWEVQAILKRRDAIVAHFDRLVAARGEASVLF